VSRDSHDRVAFVRSASFRNWGWDWLQDKHVQPDRLILPGVSLSDDAEPPSPLLPRDCPGLRIIRVRDRSSTEEVARGFAADYRTTSVRISALFGFSARLFYSVNPRSDQMQTPSVPPSSTPTSSATTPPRRLTPARWRSTPCSYSQLTTQPTTPSWPATCAAPTCTPSRPPDSPHQCTYATSPRNICETQDDDIKLRPRTPPWAGQVPVCKRDRASCPLSGEAGAVTLAPRR
jgi:hypothetical protein